MMINLETHHHFFQSDQTRSIAWRKKQLRLLLKSINKNEKALYKAFKIDLHKGEFEMLTSEIGLIKRSIRNTLKHLSEWTGPHHAGTFVPNTDGQTTVIYTLEDAVNDIEWDQIAVTVESSPHHNMPEGNVVMSSGM